MKTSKIKNGLVVMVFVLSVLPVWGHSDWGFTKDFGNVRVTYWCGFGDHEERYKSHIIAQLVEILSKELNCKQPIYLDFKHSYVEDIVPEYKLWYKRGELGDTLLFHVHVKTYDAVKTLQLIEYGIKNKASVLKKQRDTIIDTRYWGPQTHRSLSRAEINKILGKNVSPLVSKVLANKIYRPKDESDKIIEGFTYYFPNNKYHLCYGRREGYGAVQLELDNIYQFRTLVYYDGVLSSRLGVVFNSDSTFCVITRDGYGEEERAKYVLSKRHVIKNVENIYQPYVLKQLGKSEVFIGIEQYFSGTVRNLLYRVKDDYLVQDLDVLVDEEREKSEAKEQY